MNDILKFIEPLSFKKVFDLWAKGEEYMPRWIEHYKRRGFNSWKEWRESSVEKLKLQELNWKLFEIIKPQSTVLKFYAGPFQAWINKYYEDKLTTTFEELAENQEIQNDKNINEIIESFPKESTLVGLIKDDKIIIIEGMHRCCALVVANKRGLVLNVGLSIVLAEFPKEIPILGQADSPT